MKRALVAGGSQKSLASLKRKLAERGVNVEWHVCQDNGKVPYTGIPVGCEVVLINIDAIGHKDAEQIYKDATAKGILRARVHDKWTWAEPILRMTGILDPATKDAMSPHQSAIRDTAVRYILDMMEKSHVPSLDEVEAAVQKALGPTVIIPAQWKKEIYDMASRQRAVEAAVQKGNPHQIPEADLRELVRLEVETDISLIGDIPALVKHIRDTIPNPLTDGDENIIRNEAAKILKGWKLHYKAQPPDVRSHKIRAFHNWMKRQIEASQANKGKGWPGGSHVTKILAGWGVPMSAASVAQERVKILGPWAADIFPVARVVTTFPGRCPLTKSKIIQLIEERKIKGVMIDVKGRPTWHTSVQAILDYMKGGAVPAVETKKVEPKKVETDTPVPEPTPIPEAKPPAQQSDLLSLAAMVIEDLMTGIRAEIAPLRERITALENQLGALKGTLALAEVLASAGDYEIKMTKSGPKS